MIIQIKKLRSIIKGQDSRDFLNITYNDIKLEKGKRYPPGRPIGSGLKVDYDDILSRLKINQPISHISRDLNVSEDTIHLAKRRLIDKVRDSIV